MKSRRKAREAALQALYQCDTLGDWSEANVDLYFKVFQGEALASTDSVILENLAFARRLTTGVLQNLAFLDTQISKSSTRWSIARMARVDRNILRAAAYELAFLDDIPPNVTINEAIEIAKRYGTDETHTFVNGVLDNLAGASSRTGDAQGARSKRLVCG